MSKQLLNMAAKHAVASELCRRQIRAELKFVGRGSKVTAPLFSGGEVEFNVRAKMGRTWPSCKGVALPHQVLVLVDYQGCGDTDRPTFYILCADDWCIVLERRLDEIRRRSSDKRIRVTEQFVAEFPDEPVRSTGQAWQGVDIRPDLVEEYHERWNTIGASPANQG